MKTSIRLPELTFLLSLLLCGCQSLAPQVTEQVLPLQLPEQFAGASGTEIAEPANWLDSFADPTLSQLISEGLQGNFSLQSAAARIGVARARAKQAGVELFPDLGLEFDAARRRTQNNAVGSTSNSFGLNGSVRWEVDLWQRNSATEQAAASDAEASIADYRAAQLSLAASIARSWFRVTEAALQLKLSGQTLASYQQSLEVIEGQYRRGLTSALDLRLARSALHNAEASQAERLRLHSVEQRLLEQLLGRYPAASISGGRQLPLLTGPVPAGMPSSLLERRPDLRAASFRVAAAGLRTAVAKRNRLPIFQLTGAAGTASDQLYQLFDWDYLVWNLAASLTQSLFDGGSKTAAQELAASQFEQQLADYAEVALAAFREVEAALAAEATLKQQGEALRFAVGETDAAKLLAEQRYQQGLEGIVTLLETQRRAFSARSNILRVERLRLENRIDLHLALGGSLGETDQPKKMMESP